MQFFIWKIDELVNEDVVIQENTRIVTELQADAPRYHTRAMQINYLRTCDLLLPKASHQHSEQYTEC